MKIVLVNTVSNTGSVGKICTSLYHLAASKGSEVHMAYGRNSCPKDMSSYKIGTMTDFFCHVLRNFFMGESGFGSTGQTIKFIHWLEEIKPDIIHLHNIHGFYLNIELLFHYLRQTDIKIIWTLHDCWAFTGHCAHFDYIQCDKWKKQCHDCAQFRCSYPYSIFKDNSYSSYTRKKECFLGLNNLTIITPSYWLANLVQESILQNYPTSVIPNGIDLDTFRPSQETPSPYRILLGVANVWIAHKGLSYFMELANMLPDQYKIQLVGLSKKQVSFFRRNYPNTIIPIQHTKNIQELSELYQHAFAFINPTLEDTFPTTNLEALACGTPVITFNTGGSPESIDATCGLVVPKGDTSALYDAILSLDANKNITRNRCRQRALLYRDTDCFQKYIDLYYNVAKP